MLTKKLPKCRVCKAEFWRWSSTQVVCLTVECAAAWARRRREKLERVAAKAGRALDRAALERMKTAKQLMPEARTAFNAYIRYRDAGLPCIDCGKPIEPNKPGGSADAGHFRSVGSAPHMRFVEDNVFAQRKNCNRPGGAKFDAFKAGVIARIGLARTEAVLADQSVRKYTADDLRELRDHYRAMVRGPRPMPPAQPPSTRP
jgi:hypothetical protein